MMSTSRSTDPDDPIQWFMETYMAHKSVNYQETVTTSVGFFRDFLEEENLEPEDVTPEDAVRFLKRVTEHYRAGTQQTISSNVSQFYDYCLKKGVPDINCNPVSIALDEHDILDENNSSTKHIISVEEMGKFLKIFDNPLLLASCLMMAKTGRRIGAVVNLDLCDVHLDHPAADWDVVQPLRHWENHLYFPPEPEREKEFRGEKRTVSSKTVSETIVPIDDELRDALIWWLTARRGDNTKHSALFTTTIGGGDKTYLGDRITRSMIYHRLTGRAKEEGHWYGANDPDNITPHYFRHFFSTRAENRMAESIVDYIRGDKGNTTRKQHYQHWDEEKEKIYRENIYKFF